MFLGFYEKRQKLQLLMAELSQIARDAEGMIIAEELNDGNRYGLPTVETRLLETILSDIHYERISRTALKFGKRSLSGKSYQQQNIRVQAPSGDSQDRHARHSKKAQ